jgi:AcrR family transcriptional regulator
MMAERSPSRPTKRRMPRDQRVAIILETARGVLRDRGSEQFLTTEVAERCGISEATIYKYFPTKRDLLIQVAEGWFDEFLAEDLPLSRKRPIRECLFQVIWNNLSIIRREPALTRFVLMEVRADPSYRQMRIYQQNREFAARVMDVVEDGIRRGELRANVSLKLVRDMIFGAIEHRTWAFLRGEGDFSVEESAEGITDIVMLGLALHPGQQGGEMQFALDRLEKIAEALRGELASLQQKGR